MNHQIGSGPFLRMTEKEFFHLFDPAIYDDEETSQGDKERQRHCVICSLINLRTGVFQTDRHLVNVFKRTTMGVDTGLNANQIFSLINTYEQKILANPDTRRLVINPETYQPSVLTSYEIINPLSRGGYLLHTKDSIESEPRVAGRPVPIHLALPHLFTFIPQGFMTVGLYTKCWREFQKDGRYEGKENGGHSHVLLFYRGAGRGRMYMLETQGSSLAQSGVGEFDSDSCCKIYTGSDMIKYFAPTVEPPEDPKIFRYTESIRIFTNGLRYRRLGYEGNPELQQWGREAGVVLSQRKPVPFATAAPKSVIPRQVSLSDDIPEGSVVVDISSGKNIAAKIRKIEWDPAGVIYSLSYKHKKTRTRARNQIVPLFKKRTHVVIKRGDNDGEIATIEELLPTSTHEPGNYQVVLDGDDTGKKYIYSGNDLEKLE